MNQHRRAYASWHLPASQGRTIIASTSLTATHVSSEPSSSGDQRPDAFRRHLSVISLLKLDLLFQKTCCTEPTAPQGTWSKKLSTNSCGHMARGRVPVSSSCHLERHHKPNPPHHTEPQGGTWGGQQTTSNSKAFANFDHANKNARHDHQAEARLCMCMSSSIGSIHQARL